MHSAVRFLERKQKNNLNKVLYKQNMVECIYQFTVIPFPAQGVFSKVQKPAKPAKPQNISVLVQTP